MSARNVFSTVIEFVMLIHSSLQYYVNCDDAGHNDIFISLFYLVEFFISLTKYFVSFQSLCIVHGESFTRVCYFTVWSSEVCSQVNLIIMLSLGSMETVHVTSETVL